MTGPIKALIWEFCRRMVLTPPLIIGILLLGPLGVEGLFWLTGLPVSDFEIPPLSWHCVYLALGFILMAIPLVEAYKGVYQRLFAFPVSNSFIATWMMSSSIVAVVGQEVVVHGLFEFTLSDWSMRAIFGDDSNLIGPCQPVFATMVSILMAMYWSLKTRSRSLARVLPSLIRCERSLPVPSGSG